MIRLKVGVSRKEATGRDASVGATCEVEVEIPGNATDEEILRVRDRWLEVCEATVDEELERLQEGPSSPKGATPSEPRREPRPPEPPRDRRGARDEGDRDRDEERTAPADGRQLLGWAAKQDPDAKGLVISFGKRRGYPAKIVDWDDEQVRAAYRFARAQQGRR